MAFPTSGLFVQTFLDALDTTQLALDLDLETHKVALWTNTGTYDLTADTAYGVAPWNANEVSGTGYTSGGQVLTNTTWTHSGSGVCKFSGDNSAWASATFSGVRGCLLYADALAGNNAICAVNFGADYAVTSGTFTIQWNVSGIFTIDFVP
jgi:hypothetical protein